MATNFRHASETSASNAVRRSAIC